MNNLKHSSLINRLIRQDDPVDLGKPTRPFIEEAIRQGKPDEAQQWLDYYLLEQQAVLNIYAVWNWYMMRYYLDKRAGSTVKEIFQKSLAPWLGTTAGLKGQPVAEVAAEGMNARLHIEGLPWDVYFTEGDRRYDISLDSPNMQKIRRAEWRGQVDAAIEAGSVDDFNRLLDSYVTREAWFIHDTSADWSWALLSVFMREWGEGILDEVLRVTEEPWVTVRYAALKEMTQEQSLQLTVEGMRGHFTGPDRAGHIFIDDEPDRYVMHFKYCGSGGRMRNGDPQVGSGSRLEAPYHFLNVEGAYGWTWNRKNVCAYCAHCAVVNQVLPIEGLGHPMRMTLYPENPTDPCRWVIYKDKTNFPEEAFTSVGKMKK